jgi:hypothetical protein
MALIVTLVINITAYSIMTLSIKRKSTTTKAREKVSRFGDLRILEIFNDTQHDDTQHNDTQHKDSHHNKFKIMGLIVTFSS